MSGTLLPAPSRCCPWSCGIHRAASALLRPVEWSQLRSRGSGAQGTRRTLQSGQGTLRAGRCLWTDEQAPSCGGEQKPPPRHLDPSPPAFWLGPPGSSKFRDAICPLPLQNDPPGMVADRLPLNRASEMDTVLSMCALSPQHKQNPQTPPREVKNGDMRS